MKKLITILLALILMLACVSAFAAGLNIKLNDFTVKTIDGKDFTLSEALKDHDLVLINLWATWCPPCKAEFPFLQEAWSKNKDRVAVIALSVEPTDTEAKLQSYARAMQLTFPIANVGRTGLDDFASSGIPTTVLVDREGSVASVEIGARFSTQEFQTLFDQYMPADSSHHLFDFKQDFIRRGDRDRPETFISAHP